MSPMCSTCPAHFILLDLITLIIFSEAHKIWSSSTCSLLHPLATCHFLLLRSKYSASAPCSQTTSIYVPASVSENIKILQL
jgi:hypothetical protein